MQHQFLLLLVLPLVAAEGANLNSPVLVTDAQQPKPLKDGELSQKWGMSDFSKMADSAKGALASGAQAAKQKALAAALKASGLCPALDQNVLDNKDALADAAAQAMAKLPKDKVTKSEACQGVVSDAIAAKIQASVPKLKGNDAVGGVLGAFTDPASADLCKAQADAMKQYAGQKDAAAKMKGNMVGTIDKTLENQLKPVCPDLFKQKKFLDFDGRLFGGLTGGSLGGTLSMVGFLVTGFVAGGLVGRHALRRREAEGYRGEEAAEGYEMETDVEGAE